MAKDREDPENIEDLIVELRQKIEEQGFDWHTQDWYLLRSLRCTFFKPEEAFKQIYHLKKFRNSHPELFQWKLEEFEKLYSANIATLLEEKASDGARVIYVALGNWNSSEFDSQTLICYATWAIGVISELDEVGRNGVHFIFDMKNFSLFQLTQLGLSNIKLLMDIVQNSNPIYVKSTNFINEGYFARILFSLIFKLLTETTKLVIYSHGTNFGKLHQYFPPEILPMEAGGTQGPFQGNSWTMELIKKTADRNWDDYL